MTKDISVTAEEARILKALVKFQDAGLLSADIKLTPEHIKVIEETGKQVQKGYSLKETAETLGVTYRTALGYVEAGTLKANKIGGKWNIDRADLEAFMQSGRG